LVIFKVGSAGKSGNSSFSFGMEVSGIVMKRSNFQLFFNDKSGSKKELVQVSQKEVKKMLESSD